MTHQAVYKTPPGFSDLIMLSDGEYLTGLRFDYPPSTLSRQKSCAEAALPIFAETHKWLDAYFSGQNPGFTPKCSFADLTPFQMEVIYVVSTIPYGKTMTYGEIAAILAEKRGMERISAQAVGGAVGRNPICIIIPCHRVIGANAKLTGYNGGLPNKAALLEHEGNCIMPPPLDLSRSLALYYSQTLYKEQGIWTCNG